MKMALQKLCALRKKRSKLRRDDGFTLLELLVVLVIIGLLSSIVGPQVMKLLGKAKGDVAKVQMSNIISSLNLFSLDIGRYPTNSEGLLALIQKPSDVTQWSGPYLNIEKVPNDPWSRPYIYNQPGLNGKPYQLKSLGADGIIGGQAEDADITKP
jgi:general secretion pathway protein G